MNRMEPLSVFLQQLNWLHFCFVLLLCWCRYTCLLPFVFVVSFLLWQLVLLLYIWCETIAHCFLIFITFLFWFKFSVVIRGTQSQLLPIKTMGGSFYAFYWVRLFQTETYRLKLRLPIELLVLVSTFFRKNNNDAQRFEFNKNSIFYHRPWNHSKSLC